MESKNESIIIGLDEVGAGSLAGPLVIAAVAFPEDRVRISGVRDSKTCSKKHMREVLPKILPTAVGCGLGVVPAKFIDEWGMRVAWQTCAREALESFSRDSLLVVDGDVEVDSWEGEQIAVPKADALYWQVSAASILAKVMRDEHMLSLSEHFAEYKWESNVGYGSKAHKQAIANYGPTRFHRKTFLKKILNPGSKKRVFPSRFSGIRAGSAE